jgi:NADH dehydrogenase
VNFNKKSRTVVIFGASGFIGRYIVTDLLKENWIIKVLVRNPDRAKHLSLMGRLGQVTVHQCNITDYNRVEKFISNSSKVINLVGILEEKSKQNFIGIHLNGAINIAKACSKYKIDTFIHFSALGLYNGDHSRYAQSKLEAEKSIKQIFKKTIIFRPSVVFGPEDNFTNKFAKMASLSIFIPLINCGKTRFQPVYVKDISQAVEKVIGNQLFYGKTYNLGGPDIMSFRDILDLILLKIRKKRIYLSLSFPVAKLIGLIFSVFPVKPITLDQVRLLEKDNIVPKSGLGFKDLGINPSSIYSISENYLKRYITSY